MRPAESARPDPGLEAEAKRLGQPIPPLGRKNIAQSLTAEWQQRGLIAWLLRPAAMLYGLLVGLRRLMYRTHALKSRRLPVPVVVVGNAISGGAGKTPTTIAIVQHLQAQGRAVGVVSRGYGRKTAGCVQVRATSTPEQVGDEPLLIFRATGAPVAVGSNRYRAALSLLQLHSELELLVCDDGLQHYGLVRDIEVCVFDNRGCGNGWLLPAGPLREPWPRALLPSVGQSASTSLVLHTGTQPAFGGYRATRSLANYAVSRDGQKTELCSLSTDPGKPLFAVAGIAQPQAFFDMLGVSQVPLSGTLGFADHTDFVTLDRNLIENYTLLCTEKDAAKLWQTAPQALAVPLVQTIEPDFYAALDSLLEPLWITKLSSCHGQKTT